jgi:Domain of unknown function (DUF1905)
MTPTIEFTFDGEIVEWRGPSPFHFVAVPEDESALIHEMASVLSYGWGVIPVRACIGTTDYKTSLFPRNGGYLVPVKDVVRRAEGLAIGDPITVTLVLDMSKA